MLLSFRSTLLKIIPELGDAGKILRLTFFPVWIPTPFNDILLDTVDWDSNDIDLNIQKQDHV